MEGPPLTLFVETAPHFSEIFRLRGLVGMTSLHDASTTLFAFCLVSLGTFSNAFGSFITRRRPLAGNFLTMVVGTTCHVMSVQYASASTLSASAGLIVGWSVFLSPFFVEGVFVRRSLREALAGLRAEGPRSLGGLAIVAGCTLAMYNGPSNRDFDSRDVVPLLCTVAMGSIACLFHAIACDSNVLARSALFKTIVPGVLGGFTNACMKSLSWSKRDERLVIVTFFVATVSFGAYQAWLLNCVLREYGADEVIPLYVIALIISNVAIGGLAFAEFDDFPLARLPYFLAGLGLGIWGVNVHRRHKKDLSPHHFPPHSIRQYFLHS